MAAESLVGSVPDDWTLTTLGDACQRGGGDVQTGPFGSQLHAADYVPDGIPSIMPQNIGDNRIVEDGIARITLADAERLARYRVKAGDIVYSRRGDVERRALVRTTEDGWLCGTGCLRVRFGDDNVVPAYASYYLGHPSVREWIVRHAHGATMANLNTSILSSLPFVVPPPLQQRAIAHVLGTLDDKIELNRRMNQTLEAIARALFTSWFVDFDPVHAKAEGRQPEGMNAETAALFPSEFEESDIGSTPQGWRVEPLSMAAHVNPGRPLRRGDVAPYLDMANVPITGSRANTWVNRPFGSGARFQNGDVLVARITPCLENGKTAFVDFLNDEQVGWGSTEFIVLRSRAPLPPVWAYCLARDSNFREYSIRSMGGTSGRQRVPAEAVSRFKVVIPADPIAERFTRIVEPLFDAIKHYDEESRILASVRNTLLPRLLSGELPLPVADALVEAAL